MQAHQGGDVAAELQVGGLATAQGIAQDLVDRITPEGQLQFGGQHLEAGQGFLQGASAPQQGETGPIPLTQFQAGSQGR